ncbi:glutamate ABC transporter substrate-binding protein [Streptomyces montanisoli]|uniref:Glutamate ABC transporter substrate-binding protein n=1 Tax=Streptomyces montanisoli TaxID=2798581 RepID=A0A940MII6_9ACTN|nr:glutamate ABC transporter substrate-binding protein [Streptomyces montanisoli]MBP0461702.1 glutamate ABC transporter substrate-binding protein [Streptomyces montanisoli]
MGHASGRLRGWGGVTAMGAACAVTAALTLVPLSHHGTGSAGPSAAPPVHRVEAAARETADAGAEADCPSTGRPAEASLPPSSGSGPTIDKMLRREGDARKLIVGVDQNSYRWGYLNPATDAFEGFDIDLAHAIAKSVFGDANAITFRPVSTKERTTELANGSVDIVVRTMTISCDRLKEAEFSTAYFTAGQQVLAPRSSTITGYNRTLAHKRVCTATGSTGVQELEKDNPYGAYFWDASRNVGHNPDHVDVDDLSVPNQLDCLVRLQLGLVDAVITDNALAAAQAAQDPAVELKGEPFTTEYYGVAARRGADDLVARINYVLEQYRSGGADSAWQKSYDKWLKAELGPTTGPPAPRYLPGA